MRQQHGLTRIPRRVIAPPVPAWVGEVWAWSFVALALAGVALTTGYRSGVLRGLLAFAATWTLLWFRVVAPRLAEKSIWYGLILYLPMAVALIFHTGGLQSPFIPLLAVLPAVAAIYGELWIAIGFAAGGTLALPLLAQSMATPAPHSLLFWTLFFAITGTLSALFAAHLRTHHQALHTMATRDLLTNLPNREAFEEALGRSDALARRSILPYTLILLDIDDFHLVNEREGYVAGDETLVTWTGVLHRELRATDFLARVGSDEFAVLLPGLTVAEAQRVAERIRSATAAAMPFTVSAGVADWTMGHYSTGVWQAAERALLDAKTAGKDRVINATPLKAPLQPEGGRSPGGV